MEPLQSQSQQPEIKQQPSQLSFDQIVRGNNIK
jgi:hypothetical protein